MNLAEHWPYIVVAVALCLLAFFLRELKLLLIHPEQFEAEHEPVHASEEAADDAA